MLEKSMDGCYNKYDKSIAPVISRVWNNIYDLLANGLVGYERLNEALGGKDPMLQNALTKLNQGKDEDLCFFPYYLSSTPMQRNRGSEILTAKYLYDNQDLFKNMTQLPREWTEQAVDLKATLRVQQEEQLAKQLSQMDSIKKVLAFVNEHPLVKKMYALYGAPKIEYLYELSEHISIELMWKKKISVFINISYYVNFKEQSETFPEVVAFDGQVVELNMANLLNHGKRNKNVWSVNIEEKKLECGALHPLKITVDKKHTSCIIDLKEKNGQAIKFINNPCFGFSFLNKMARKIRVDMANKVFEIDWPINGIDINLESVAFHLKAVNQDCLWSISWHRNWASFEYEKVAGVEKGKKIKWVQSRKKQIKMPVKNNLYLRESQYFVINKKQLALQLKYNRPNHLKSSKAFLLDLMFLRLMENPQWFEQWVDEPVAQWLEESFKKHLIDYIKPLNTNALNNLKQEQYEKIRMLNKVFNNLIKENTQLVMRLMSVMLLHDPVGQKIGKKMIDFLSINSIDQSTGDQLPVIDDKNINALYQNPLMGGWLNRLHERLLEENFYEHYSITELWITNKLLAPIESMQTISEMIDYLQTKGWGSWLMDDVDIKQLSFLDYDEEFEFVHRGKVADILTDLAPFDEEPVQKILNDLPELLIIPESFSWLIQTRKRNRCEINNLQIKMDTRLDLLSAYPKRPVNENLQFPQLGYNLQQSDELMMLNYARINQQGLPLNGVPLGTKQVIRVSEELFELKNDTIIRHAQTRGYCILTGGLILWSGYNIGDYPSNLYDIKTRQPIHSFLQNKNGLLEQVIFQKEDAEQEIFANWSVVNKKLFEYNTMEKYFFYTPKATAINEEHLGLLSTKERELLGAVFINLDCTGHYDGQTKLLHPKMISDLADLTDEQISQVQQQLKKQCQSVWYQWLGFNDEPFYCKPSRLLTVPYMLEKVNNQEREARQIEQQFNEFLLIHGMTKGVCDDASTNNFHGL